MSFWRRNNKSPDDTPESGRSGVASGCLGVVLDVGVWVLSTLLVTVGVFVLLFGVLDFSPESRLRTVLLAIFVPVAVYVLIRIGRQILKDLRE